MQHLLVETTRLCFYLFLCWCVIKSFGVIQGPGAGARPGFGRGAGGFGGGAGPAAGSDLP